MTEHNYYGNSHDTYDHFGRMSEPDDEPAPFHIVLTKCCGWPVFTCDRCGHKHCPAHDSVFDDEHGLYRCPKCGYEYGVILQMSVRLKLGLKP